MPVSSTTSVKEFWGIYMPAAIISAFAVDSTSSQQFLSMIHTEGLPLVRVAINSNINFCVLTYPRIRLSIFTDQILIMEFHKQEFFSRLLPLTDLKVLFLHLHFIDIEFY
jgi:hypothetical protein